MQFRHAAGVLLILTATSLPALAQSHPGISRDAYDIAGTVRDDFDQHTMDSVRVDLKQSTGTPINSTFTRDNGDFEFSGIPSGDYSIDITVPDYEPYRETLTINHSERRGLAVFLRRPRIVVTTDYNNTISAHELSVPNKPHDEYEKGLRLIYSKSDYKGAIEQFERAIKDFPNFYEAYAQEGNAYTFLGQNAPAEEAMRKSIALSSNQYPEAFFLLAGLLNNTSRYAEAEPVARQGVTLDGSSWHGHFELARALTALKRPEEAEKSATQARDLKPDNSAIFLLLANIHIQLRDHVALKKDLDQYLKVAPTGPAADQARRTQNQLQAILQSEQDQERGKNPTTSRSVAQEQAKSNPPGQATRSNARDQSKPDEREQSQADEQEPAFLPPLPPPQPEP
jgi:tetratricopeptide (TPR) repeat protein